MEARWRDAHGGDAGPIAMLGYVFIRVAKAKGKYPPERLRLNGVDMLFLGVGLWSLVELGGPPRDHAPAL